MTRRVGCNNLTYQFQCCSSCRSEHARDGGANDAGIQTSRVIVDDNREHARSYSEQHCINQYRLHPRACNSAMQARGGKQANSCLLKLKKLSRRSPLTHQRGARLPSFFIDSEHIFTHFLPVAPEPLSPQLIVNGALTGAPGACSDRLEQLATPGKKTALH
ncbi:hypothetical protein [Pseudomonas sp. NPDC089569]|uniref:hypothetical protein n=1 Tax=Pseudomonas sp. NPDC089569 TaxID=3390722 RepID=UPI003D02FD53